MTTGSTPLAAPPPPTGPTDAGRSGPTRRLVAAVLVAAALAYSAWLAQPLTGSQLDPRTSYVSEGYALDQPHSALFRALEAGSAALLVLAAFLLWRGGWTRRSPAARGAPVRHARGLAVLALAAFGLGTLLDALFPLACAPTSDPACRAAELARTVPLHHTIHTVSSTLSGTAVVVAAGAHAVAAGRARRGGHPGRARTAWLVFVAAAVVVTMLWTLWEIAASYAPELAPWAPGALGWAQRAQLATVACWLLTLAAET